MSNNSDKPTTARPQPKFLSALRDVLFESTPDSTSSASSQTQLGPQSTLQPVGANHGAATGADLAAARVALQQSIGEQLGPAVRELMLQTEGLREVLPDAAQRQKAALKVLALRGISSAMLVLELEHVLAALMDQSSSFASKLEARKATFEEQRRAASTTYQNETTQAERTIQRLRAELEQEQQRLALAATARDTALAECDQHLAELIEKQRAFELAFQEACAQYRTLKQQLTAEHA